jgi:hypothetical protein
MFSSIFQRIKYRLMLFWVQHVNKSKYIKSDNSINSYLFEYNTWINLNILNLITD